MPPPSAPTSARRPSIALGAAAALGFALLYLPMPGMLVQSFNVARTGLVWRGFGVDAWLRVFSDRAVREAARNTLVLASVSTAIATPLGMALAFALARGPRRFRGRRLAEVLTDLPVVMPDIVLAAALVVAFSVLRPLSRAFAPGMTTMVLGHVSFQIPFVALVVRGRLSNLGNDLEEAAADLHAGRAARFLRVTLPLVAPAAIAGAILAFTLSLDDFVVGFFLHGPDSVTLPLHVHSAMRRAPAPELSAISTAFAAATMALVLLAARLAAASRPGRPSRNDGP